MIIYLKTGSFPKILPWGWQRHLASLYSNVHPSISLERNSWPVESQQSQSHFILTMSHWSSGLPVCFPLQGTQVQIPWGVLMWFRDFPVRIVSLHWWPRCDWSSWPRLRRASSRTITRPSCRQCDNPTWSHTAFLSRFHACCRSPFRLHNWRSWLLGRACNLTSFLPCLTGPVDYLFTSHHKGTQVQIPRGVLMWNRDFPVRIVSLQATRFQRQGWPPRTHCQNKTLPTTSGHQTTAKFSQHGEFLPLFSAQLFTGVAPFNWSPGGGGGGPRHWSGLPWHRRRSRMQNASWQWRCPSSIPPQMPNFLLPLTPPILISEGSCSKNLATFGGPLFFFFLQVDWHGVSLLHFWPWVFGSFRRH
jgi:hypothetical protein